MTETPRAWTPELAERLVLDTTPWLSCEDCFRLVDQYVEELLRDPEATRPAMDTHLRGCAACAEEAVSLLELTADEGDVDAAPALRHLAEITG